jgi:transposase
MPNYQPYSPDQAELLPAHVKDVLGSDHLCFLVHEVVESVDLQGFEDEEEDAGGQRPYHPRLMLKVWLYGFGVNVRTTRKLEQRIREDLAFRYLAGGASPDHKTLNEFQRRHRAAITDLFTQVLLFLRRAGLARLGTVAIDSTRVKAQASRDRVLRQDDLERELRQKVERWQRELDDDPDREPGTRVGQQEIERVRQKLERLRQSGENKLSVTDPDARFLRERGGRFVLGYTAEIAVSEDHFIVAQRVTQNKNDNHALVPMVDEVERQCAARPLRVLADSGFFCNENLEEMEARGIEAYLPDTSLARELETGETAGGVGRMAVSNPSLLRLRQRLRTSEGRTWYKKRKGLVEPVFGILKEQRGMRQFQRRGLSRVALEWTLAAIAHNLIRYHILRRSNR